MLRTKLIHPELLAALGSAGHGAKVLIADGNYPVGTKAPPHAARIYLNLPPASSPSPTCSMRWSKPSPSKPPR